ncbi:MAG: hypothetical protein J6Q62_04355 [Alistipes sp.]|jgi:hypothetical protein|nr:hypothetical protein [Alistipes sp.]
MLRRISLIVVALFLFVTGVEAKGRDVVVEGVSRVTHISSSGMNLWLDVRNERCSRLVLKRGEVEIKVDGRTRVVVSLRDKVVVRGRSSEEVLIPLRFKSRTTFALGSILRKVITKDMEDITISYEVRGGTMLFRRTLRGEDVVLRDVVESLGISERVLTQLEHYID